LKQGVRATNWMVGSGVRAEISQNRSSLLPWGAAAEVELGVVGAELVAVGGGGDDLAEGREGLGRGLHRPQRHHPRLQLRLLCPRHLRGPRDAGVGAHRPAAC
jgi:hypothetical protein